MYMYIDSEREKEREREREREREFIECSDHPYSHNVVCHYLLLVDSLHVYYIYNVHVLYITFHHS